MITFSILFFFCFLGETENEQRIAARGTASEAEGNQPVSETPYESFRGETSHGDYIFL